MADKMRMTLATWAVLKALLDDGGELYGLQIIRACRLQSGTVYPILARLLEAGYAASRWEDIDPRPAGRPPRRYYRITEAGRGFAKSIPWYQA